MMNFDEIVVKESPGLCRCCLSEGCYKDMGTEYSWMTETEVYADMLLECFDISISQHSEGPNGPNRLICEVCITRLRDACNFKKQVVDSEKRFIDMLARGEFKQQVMIYQTQPQQSLKEEHLQDKSDPDGEVEYLEDVDFDDIDDIPLTKLPSEPSSSDQAKPSRKRGRPKKSTTEQVAKKTDKPKVKVNRGNKPTLVREGKSYFLHHTLQNGAQMWCCTSGKSCSAKLKLYQSTILREDPHTCKNTSQSIVKDFKKELRTKAVKEHSPITKIYKDCVKKYINAGIDIPSFKSVKSRLYKARKNAVSKTAFRNTHWVEIPKDMEVILTES